VCVCLEKQSKMEAKVFPDGSAYDGEIANGQFHGKGTFTFPDGTTLTGTFVNGKAHGDMTYSFTTGSTCVVTFDNGQRSAAAPQKFSTSRGSTWSGSLAEADWRGSHRSFNGDAYEGEFLGGKV
jgi:hypothetical protein